jgi:hypothetical protein
MDKFVIEPANRVAATQLAPALRHCDKLEIFRASGMTALDALLDSIAVSDEDMCWVAKLNGHPVAMFGVNDVTPEGEDPQLVGGIWLLASPGIYTNKLDFMRHCKDYLAVMHERYEYLTNFIDEDNIVTMQWLPRLGFIPMNRVAEFGHAKLPFVQYLSKRK